VTLRFRNLPLVGQVLVDEPGGLAPVVLYAPFFTSCEVMEFAETGHSGEERPYMPVSLLMVLHALQVDCEKSMKLTASCHRSSFCFSRDGRNEAALSKSVPPGACGEEKLAVSFGPYNTPRLLDVVQESRISPSCGCFFVNPVDMLAVEVNNIQTGVLERRDDHWCESRELRFVDVNDLMSCNVYAQMLRKMRPL